VKAVTDWSVTEMAVFVAYRRQKMILQARKDLISNRKCNTKLLLGVISLSGPKRKDEALGGNKV